MEWAMNDEGNKNDFEHHVHSIAYCGLICDLCYLHAQCDGCRAVDAAPDKRCPEVDCFLKACCLRNGYDGCWECGKLEACTEGIYSSGDLSKIKAFALCIRDDGEETFMEYVMKNNKKGWSVERGKDYDGKPIATVLKMLRGK